MPWRRRLREPEVVMLSRPGCHLCEEMLAVVSPQAPRLQVRDIDADRDTGRMDAATHDGWTSLLPVLLVDGEQVAHWRVTAEEVRVALRAARRR